MRPPDSPWADLDYAMSEYRRWLWSLDDDGVEVLLEALEPAVGTPDQPLRLVLLTAGMLAGAPVPAPGWPTGMRLLRLLRGFAYGEVTEAELLEAADKAAPPHPFATTCEPDAVEADAAWCRQRVALTGCTEEAALEALPGPDSNAGGVASREPHRSDEPGTAIDAACASAWRSVMRTTPIWADVVVSSCMGLGRLQERELKFLELGWLFSAEADVARGAVLAGASTASEVLRVLGTSEKATLDAMWGRADAVARQLWPEVPELRRLAAGEIKGAEAGLVSLVGSDDPTHVAHGLELWRLVSLGDKKHCPHSSDPQDWHAPPGEGNCHSETQDGDTTL